MQVDTFLQLRTTHWREVISPLSSKRLTQTRIFPISPNRVSFAKMGAVSGQQYLNSSTSPNSSTRPRIDSVRLTRAHVQLHGPISIVDGSAVVITKRGSLNARADVCQSQVSTRDPLPLAIEQVQTVIAPRLIGSCCYLVDMHINGHEGSTLFPSQGCLPVRLCFRLIAFPD